MTHPQSPAAPPETGGTAAGASALERLAVYRERREALHEDVAEALADGKIPAEIARVSGLSRQWVARIARNDQRRS